MTNETLIMVVVIESVAILGAFFLHRWLTGVPKPHGVDHERVMEKILERQRNAARFQAIARRDALKHPTSHQNITNGYILSSMPKKLLLHDLFKGFEEYAKLRGYDISFSLDTVFTEKVELLYKLDLTGLADRPPRFPQDLQDYINMVQKRDSLDEPPVVFGSREALDWLSSPPMENPQLILFLPFPFPFPNHSPSAR